MKKFSILIAAVLMMSAYIPASAQFMNGNGGRSVSSPTERFNAFWAGYAPTSMRSGSVSVSGFNTFSIGVTHTGPLAGSPILLEYGGYLDWTNKAEKEGKYKVHTDILDVKIPGNVIYPLNLADNVKLYPYAGLNARVFVLGTATERYEDVKETENLFEDGDIKRFSLGFQVGIRAGFGKFIAGIGYEDMLTSISDELTTKVNYITLHIGIPF